MSNLDEIWKLFSQLRQNRNLWAHYRKAPPLDLNPTPSIRPKRPSASSMVQPQANAFS